MQGSVKRLDLYGLQIIRFGIWRVRYSIAAKNKSRQE
jgi:hypothetical protein